MTDLQTIYLTDVRRTYRNYRALADAAIAQASDAVLVAPLDAEANSIAVIMQHVAGNLLSRFTDFLTTDGEKSTRDRDAEFEAGTSADLARIRARWAQAWDVLTGVLDNLTPADLDRTVTIRGEAFAVLEALSRSATHTAYHVGQIVLLAKHGAGPHWTSLSIPKGQSKGLDGRFKQGFLPPR